VQPAARPPLNFSESGYLTVLYLVGYYKTMIKICNSCHNEFKIRPSRCNQKYCSQRCFAESRKKGKNIICHTCGKKIYKRNSDLKKSKSGFYFCSKTCLITWSNTQRKGEKHPNFISGQASYNKRAKEEYGEKCANGEKCPLSHLILPSYMYEVDHIDGNHKNNHIENLKVLCVWCHRQKHWG